MIALEFAPCRSAGVQRTLRFSEFLKGFNWQALVLTATENIYTRRDDTLQVSPEVEPYVVRAQCHDAATKYAIKGRYFQWMTLPDRYWPWYFDAVKKGAQMIEQEQPEVIWSTYPVLTAHWIARRLQKKYKLPWIADFRDPLQCRYDTQAQSFSWLKKWMEKRVVQSATKVVFTSDRAAQLYRDLYKNEPKEKFVTIENGYYLHEKIEQTKAVKQERFTLLYSGSLYANGRDPQPLFQAIAKLKQEKVINKDNFTLRFRPGKSSWFQKELAQLDIAELIEFLPSVSFDEAQQEMMSSSATLLIQDEIFCRQIPGKIYEYISAKKPILAISPKDSATADLIEKLPFGFSAWGVDNIAVAMKSLLSQEVGQVDIEQYSRQSKTKVLANILDNAVNEVG